MNRTDLINSVSTSTALPKETVALVLDTCFATITEQLVAGEKVTIPNFGIFEVIGRSGIKGGPSTARQKRLANFRAGKGLNERLTEPTHINPVREISERN